MNNHGYAKHTPTSPWARGHEHTTRAVPARNARRHAPGQRPLPALRRLRGQPLQWDQLTLAAGETLIDTGALDGRSIEIEWTVWPDHAVEFGLQVRSGPGEATLIGVDRRRGMLFIDRQRSGVVPLATAWAGRREAPLDSTDGPLTLRVLLDRCSVEVFTATAQPR